MDRNYDPRRRRNNNQQLAVRSERSIGQGLSNEEKFPMPPRAPKREYDPCPISGKPIDNILTALTHRETEKPALFESVVELLRNAEQIPEEQSLIYIGSGTFGVYQEIEENGRRQPVLQRRIVYEDSHHKPDWRRELSPGISRDYQPHPQPLSELYTPEELQQFPKIGASSGAYMPRNT